uniref:TTF-type domain-containing protein n=1 Tax=Chrysemys picta bellii TaxID=8478 RepID=A0A8C3HKU9_CHRPI
MQKELEKIPKLSTYFALQSNVQVQAHETDSASSEESYPEVSRSASSEVEGEASCSTKQTVTDIPAAAGKEVSESEPLTDDPGDWLSIISDRQVCDIVARGPLQQNESYEFPFNEERRRFTSTHFYRTMANGEKIRRSWLMYSVQKDAIFCFCCKLFGTGDIPLRRGTSAWKALSKRLQQHETGKSHQDCRVKWFDLRSGIVNRTSIDHLELQAFLKERDFWRNVVKRMVDVIIFLSERNLAFRGSNEKLGDPSNGNFLGLFELLAKYDTVLSELLQRIKKAETSVQYLSPQIQNELIQLVASNIQEANIAQLKKAKYYSVILDCTPDVSHEEQMSVVLRFVECNGEGGVNIREAFVGFLNVHDTTGVGLLEAFLEKANNLGIDIADMRGQAYDNGANMRGKNKGVQAHMLEINDRALYVPCGAHTWNLVISHAAKSSKYAVDFFGLINRIHVIFSSSPSHWDILQEHMPISVKGLSDTRWELRIDAVKPLR